MIDSKKLMNRNAAPGRTRKGRVSYIGFAAHCKELCRIKTSADEVLTAVRERWPATKLEWIQEYWLSEHPKAA